MSDNRIRHPTAHDEIDVHFGKMRVDRTERRGYQQNVAQSAKANEQGVFISLHRVELYQKFPMRRKRGARCKQGNSSIMYVVASFR